MAAASSAIRNPRHGRDPSADRQRFRFASGSQEFRRRRFAGGQCGRQRNGCWRRSGHRQRGCWPPVGIFIETAQNDPLDRRVEIAHDGRWRCEGAGLVALP